MPIPVIIMTILLIIGCGAAGHRRYPDVAVPASLLLVLALLVGLLLLSRYGPAPKPQPVL